MEILFFSYVLYFWLSFAAAAPIPSHVKVEPGDQPPHKAPRPEMSIFDDDDDDVEITAIETVTVEAMAQAEVQRYRRLPKLPMGQDPLLWWQQHELELPGLTKLALKYAVVQATSVPAERVFSTAGDIVTAQRSCLHKDAVDALIFLKKNMDGPCWGISEHSLQQSLASSNQYY